MVKYFEEKGATVIDNKFDEVGNEIVADAIANLQLTAIDRKKEYNSEAKIITKLQTVNLNQTFYEFIFDNILITCDL